MYTGVSNNWKLLPLKLEGARKQVFLEHSETHSHRRGPSHGHVAVT